MKLLPLLLIAMMPVLLCSCEEQRYYKPGAPGFYARDSSYRREHYQYERGRYYPAHDRVVIEPGSRRVFVY